MTATMPEIGGASEVIHRCSKGWGERCARAKGKRCKCACGGHNHNQVSKRAAEANAVLEGFGPVAPKVGDVWTFARGCMGNPVGSKAVCYEVYALGGRPGASFIFPNGAYDGFSPTDLDIFGGQPAGRAAPVVGYAFRNVGQVGHDFRNGVFASAFEDGTGPTAMAKMGRTA